MAASIHEDMGDLLKKIYEWIDEKDMCDFDTKFLDSMQERLDNYQELTDNMKRAIVNIYNGFNIGE